MSSMTPLLMHCCSTHTAQSLGASISGHLLLSGVTAEVQTASSAQTELPAAAFVVSEKGFHWSCLTCK